jgi:hypothetical protein
LRLSVLNYQRAGDCNNPELKAKFFEIAGQYADLALQIDDPAAWHAKMISANTKPKGSAKSRSDGPHHAPDRPWPRRLQGQHRRRSTSFGVSWPVRISSWKIWDA